MSLADPPTAVAASTDLVGVGALHAAHRLGIPVPASLSVVGFDDILIAAHSVPALTTVRMPIAEIVGPRGEPGRGAGPRPRRGPRSRLATFPLPLIVRDSTAPPHRS